VRCPVLSYHLRTKSGKEISNNDKLYKLLDLENQVDDSVRVDTQVIAS